MRRAAAIAVGALLLVPAPAEAQSTEVSVTTDLRRFVLDLDDGVLDLEVTTSALDGSTAQTESADSVNVVLAADVFFAFGEARLTPAARQVLGDLADQLQERASGRVRVVGHTDGKGDAPANVDLSERRAQAVVQVLAPRMPGLSLVADGRGESEPVAKETTPTGKDDPQARARNRRVAVTYGRT